MSYYDTVLESFQVNGYTVEILPDECPSNPRGDTDCNFLFLGFPHRRYNVGDETIDPERMVVACATCSGTCDTIDCADEHCGNCDECGGVGERPVRGWDDIVAWVTKEHDALQVEPVGMIDHSGVSYYLGGGPHWSDSAGWDSGTCGLMVYTKAMKEAWGSAEPGDEIRTQMANELVTYTAWCNGDAQGYVIKDLTGEMVDSCWGYFGTDDKGEYWAASEGRSVAESLPSADEQRLAWAATFV